MLVSIVIPVYNEATRLPAFLNRLSEFINKSSRSFEVIIVDDGSCDDTLSVVEPFKRNISSLLTIRIRKNRGKGYAVKRGLFIARGEVCLFIDADGSVPPEEIEKNIHYLETDGYDIFVGSRVMRSAEQVFVVRWYKKALANIFYCLVRRILFKQIKDTQCGFKMFKRCVIRPLCSRSYLRRFSFDLEILFLAHKMGYKVKEGPISWTDMPGSKMNRFIEPIRMLLDILRIRNWHWTPIRPADQYMGPDEYRFMYEMEANHWWFVAHRELATGLIRSLELPQPLILDAGSGCGANLTYFQGLGIVYGADISSKAVDFCTRRGLQNVFQAPVEKLPFREKTFDIITAMDILEHTVNPIAALAELRRVLKDDGTIIIMVPAMQLLWSQHDEALGHFRRYTRSTLFTDLHESGLRCERMSFFYFLPLFVVAPIRIARRFFVNQKSHRRSDTTTYPPRFLNRLLILWLKLEAKIAINHSIPIGTSLCAMARKVNVIGDNRAAFVERTGARS